MNLIPFTRYVIFVQCVYPQGGTKSHPSWRQSMSQLYITTSRAPVSMITSTLLLYTFNCNGTATNTIYSLLSWWTQRQTYTWHLFQFPLYCGHSSIWNCLQRIAVIWLFPNCLIAHYLESGECQSWHYLLICRWKEQSL